MDEGSVEEERTDVDVVHLAGKSVEGTFAKAFPILTDGSQRRNGIAAQGDVIIAQDADVLRYTESQLLTVYHDAVSQNIMTA